MGAVNLAVAVLVKGIRCDIMRISGDINLRIVSRVREDCTPSVFFALTTAASVIFSCIFALCVSV